MRSNGGIAGAEATPPPAAAGAFEGVHRLRLPEQKEKQLGPPVERLEEGYPFFGSFFLVGEPFPKSRVKGHYWGTQATQHGLGASPFLKWGTPSVADSTGKS